jgi:hypothetical protein
VSAVSLRPGSPTSALFAALILAVVSAQAQTVRCESRDGKVTYANTACPDGSKAVRTLPEAGDPAPEDVRAARERLKQDKDRVTQIDRARRTEEEQAARARALRDKEQAEQDRACRKLALQVAQIREDLGRAAFNRRDALERRLQRLSEQHAADCGK